jgi:hypothetical protein
LFIEEVEDQGDMMCIVMTLRFPLGRERRDLPLAAASGKRLPMSSMG